MRLATIDVDGFARPAVVVGGDRLLDLEAASGGALTSMLAIIEGGPAVLDRIATLAAAVPGDHLHDIADARFLAPLPVPNSIRDFSNFEEHVRGALETSMRLRSQGEADPEAAYARFRSSGAYDVPPSWYERPYYFKGNRMTCSGHRSTIRWPRFTALMDYECEFAAIIGRRGVDVAEADAAQHIFGYTIYNDFSARDEQVRDQQFRMGPSKGKDFDTGNAMGPWIVTRDELPDVSSLRMQSRINGEVQATGSSAGMQFSFDACIAFVSRDETLYPGDVLGSGTMGRGCGFETGRYLEPGDTTELEVEGIGTLVNTIGERRG